MRSIRYRVLGSILALALLVLSPVWSPGVQAQATINSTTLAAALTISADRLTLTSASTVVAGHIIYIDREAMEVKATPTTAVVQVRRGAFGTAAAAHASGAYTFTGPANYFGVGNDPAGPCTSTSEVALPRVILDSGNVFQCSNSYWVRYRLGGVAAFSPGPTQTYTSAGAITVQPGLQLIGGSGALAMTLAAPSALQEGMEMQIIASVAQAHTITFTAGFNGGTTARDVCTLGGAIGDGIAIKAASGVWYVTANRNCTLAIPEPIAVPLFISEAPAALSYVQ